jgi:thiol-disulfide isomerase/thioredoxin
MKVTDLEGVETEFSGFRGRVVILNFWATWCAPCIAEMPSLARLREATSDLDVELACVSREPADTISGFIVKRGPLDVPIYVLDGEPPECFATRGVPATFVIDKTGRIALNHTGATAWDDGGVVAFVRGLAVVPER